MTPEQKAAFINAQVASALAEMNGMVAENQYRAHHGNSPAYVEEHFLAIPDKYGIGHNAVVSFMRD